MRSIKVNAVLNTVQNICKILFPLITIPYASRVLGATNYGRVSFGNSIVRYFILLAALGVATYAQREASGFRDDKPRLSKFVNEVYTINVVATIASYGLLLVLIASSNKLHNYSTLIVIQSAAIFLYTIGADWINVIFEDFFYIAVRNIAIQVISIIAMFLFVKTAEDYYIFAIINVFATAGSNLFNVIYIRRFVHLKIVNPKSCARHMKPIFMLFCVSITTIIYVSSGITIIGFFMTDADVGVYTMAANIYSVFKQIISAIIIVCIPRLANYLGNNRRTDYVNLARKLIDALVLLVLPTIVGLFFLSRSLLIIMGGKEYLDGESSLMILGIALLFATLAGFYANGYLLLVRKDSIYLFATTISALVNIIINIVLIPIMGIIAAAVTTLIAEIIMTIISGKYAIKEYGKDMIVSKSAVLSSTIGSVGIAVVCLIVRVITRSTIITVALSFICGVVVYYCVLIITKNDLALEIARGIRKKVLSQ